MQPALDLLITLLALSPCVDVVTEGPPPSFEVNRFREVVETYVGAERPPAASGESCRYEARITWDDRDDPSRIIVLLVDAGEVGTVIEPIVQFYDADALRETYRTIALKLRAIIDTRPAEVEAAVPALPPPAGVIEPPPAVEPIWTLALGGRFGRNEAAADLKAAIGLWVVRRVSACCVATMSAAQSYPSDVDDALRSARVHISRLGAGAGVRFDLGARFELVAEVGAGTRILRVTGTDKRNEITTRSTLVAPHLAPGISAWVQLGVVTLRAGAVVDLVLVRQDVTLLGERVYTTGRASVAAEVGAGVRW